jgi:hypothetical protein
LGAIGLASLLAGVLLLTQSRGVVPALLLSAAVLVALVPGRVRRVWVFLIVLAPIGVLSSRILDITKQTDAGGTVLEETNVSGAAGWILVAACLTTALWGGWLYLVRPFVSQRLSNRSLGRLSLAAFATTACLAAGGLVATVGDPVKAANAQWEAFVHLDRASPGESRLLSGGGNRYDYWRIALIEFKDDPMTGVGAGNYDVRYFRERRTTEDIKQPHSLPLQTLAELGLVGFVFLALFLVPVLVGLSKRAAALRREATGAVGLVVASGGIVLAWLVHTSVDWLHLIPGVTGIALCAAAVLVGPWRSTRQAPARAARTVALIALAGLVLFGALTVGRSTLALHYRTTGQEKLSTEPAAALAKAKSSLSLNDEALPTYYLLAAAQARFGHAALAIDSLREAARREPHDPVPWALLADIAVRRGNTQAAQRYYQRAHELNPRDPALRRLAEDPASAAGATGATR